MFEIISKGIAKVFGTKSDKDIKGVMPYVHKTNEEYAKLASISHDELRGKTVALKKEIADRLLPIDEKILDLRTRAAGENVDVHTKEALFENVDKLEKDRDKELEVVLLEILPRAFAIVKETARRFKENATLEVTATLHDKINAAKHEHVDIAGDKAIWKNRWKAAGNEVTWDMLHYDVQIIGGTVLHQGKIAEMATGEGKTLVATLPAFLNALAGKGVHIVTVNDYLAKRDSEWMAPIYEFHGISCDCIDKYQPHSELRKQAYLCGITYGTNNEFGFDYLRDNMSRSVEELVQKKHHYAIVDEVDSVLVDEARTPLIISGPVPRGDEQQYYQLRPRVQQLVDAQKRVVADFLNEAKKKLSVNLNDNEGGTALFRAFRGLPKHKPLIKFLSEPGMKTALQKIENHYLQDNSKLMPEADAPLYFTIDEKHNSVELTEKGIELITASGEDPHFFILPDLATAMASIQADAALSDDDKVLRTDELIQEYSIKADRIHTVNQLLKAYALFEKEVEYILVDGKVKIVDEQTGRVMEGRRYSDGLHQAIEAKENVKVEDATQTYASITLQNYFRMYHKLAGMTGTAETEAGEFWEIYKLDVVVIPTNRPISRKDMQDKVYKTVREKFNAVAEEIIELSAAGRPVLVGTTSVEISELLSRTLKMRNIKHNVLNAKQHQREAEIVAEAGQPGTVTIATNMAGRGTDIKLAPASKAAGGLAIIGTERHESRRVDRQLRGRAGRQGDPGSSQFYVSLEDGLIRMFISPGVARMMDKIKLDEGEVIQHSMMTGSIERAQRKVEENNFGMRKRLLDYDNVMNAQREVIYKRRKNALFGERLSVDIMNMIYEVCENLASHAAGGDRESFRLGVIGMFGVNPDQMEGDYMNMKEAVLTDKLFQLALNHYREKTESLRHRSFPVIRDLHMNRAGTIENIVVPMSDGKRQINILTPLNKTFETECRELITNIGKFTSLAFIDEFWKEHLRDLEDLRQSSQTAVYEQKDPLLIYKMNAFELFKALNDKINRSVVSFLYKCELPVAEQGQVQEARATRSEPRLQENKPDVNGPERVRQQPPREKPVPIKVERTVGRNDRVNVQYMDGTVKKDVKFKAVEEDVLTGKAVLLD